MPILAGLLANGESLHASGQDLIEAYVIGVETICAMAKVLNFTIMKRLASDHYPWNFWRCSRKCTIATVRC